MYDLRWFILQKIRKFALIGNGAYLEHELETLENYTKDYT